MHDLQSLPLIKLANLWAQIGYGVGPDPNAIIAEFSRREAKLSGIAFGHGHTYADGCRFGLDQSASLSSRTNAYCPCLDADFAEVLRKELGVEKQEDVVHAEEIVGREIAAAYWKENGKAFYPSWATATNIIRRVLDLHTQVIQKRQSSEGEGASP